MLKLNIKTKKKPDEIMKKALEFFGPQGQGSKVVIQTDNYISFYDSNGSTSVLITNDDKETSVDLRTLEGESKIQEFATNIK